MVRLFTYHYRIKCESANDILCLSQSWCPLPKRNSRMPLPAPLILFNMKCHVLCFRLDLTIFKRHPLKVDHERCSTHEKGFRKSSECSV